MCPMHEQIKNTRDNAYRVGVERDNRVVADYKFSYRITNCCCRLYNLIRRQIDNYFDLKIIF